MDDSIIFCEFTKWKQNPINNRGECSIQNFLLFLCIKNNYTFKHVGAHMFLFFIMNYIFYYFLLWTVSPAHMNSIFSMNSHRATWTVPPWTVRVPWARDSRERTDSWGISICTQFPSHKVSAWFGTKDSQKRNFT